MSIESDAVDVYAYVDVLQALVTITSSSDHDIDNNLMGCSKNGNMMMLLITSVNWMEFTTSFLPAFTNILLSLMFHSRIPSISWAIRAMNT